MSVLILADIHANLAALDAVLAAAGPVDAVWNLGDTVGYGPRPAATLALLRSLQPAVWLSGNHDLAAVGALDLSRFNPWASAAARWTATQLAPGDRNLLATLPVHLSTDSATFAHGSPRDPVWEYVDSREIAAANLTFVATPLCFVGHTHVPRLAGRRDQAEPVAWLQLAAGQHIDLVSGQWLINPGSVGQPRDGDPRAAFAIFEPGLGRITFHRVAYDIARTQRQMREAGLPGALIERLAFGY